MSTDNFDRIKLFDGIGLQSPAIISVLSAQQDGVEYYKLSRSIDKLRSMTADERLGGRRAKILLLLGLQHISKSAQVIPESLRSLISIAIVATPDELKAYGNYTDLLDEKGIIDILEKPVTETAFALLLKKTERVFSEQQTSDAVLAAQLSEVQKLHEIGVKFSGETDIESLTETITAVCKDVTCADAACFYLVVDRDGLGYDRQNYLSNKQLRFKYDRKNSAASFREKTMEVSNKSALSGYASLSRQTLPGYATVAQETLRIADVYELPEGAPYSINKQHDKISDYRTKSVLVAPILNRDKQTIGVIQLTNKRRHKNIVINTPQDADQHVVEFTEQDERFITALALQASIAYENLQLFDSIRALLEGFIMASVKAIEARDPTTSGHSARVATLTVSIAETVDRLTTGIYKSVKFSKKDLREIEYASLLHDFGKIGVRESVLVKANKLYEHELQSIKGRYETTRKAIQLKYANEKLKALSQHGKDAAQPLMNQLDSECRRLILELDTDLITILKANEPTAVSRSQHQNRLQTIQTKVFVYDEHEQYEYLTRYEMGRLSIRRGTLSEEEREEIQHHVSHTFEFLRQIPWTNDLRNIPLIAYAHHEKLDGSGYPNRLPAEAIPIQSKMMAICDIYDALTAADRPYKKALPTERAFDILHDEAAASKVDADLLNVFIEGEVFKTIRSFS